LCEEEKDKIEGRRCCKLLEWNEIRLYDDDDDDDDDDDIYIYIYNSIWRCPKLEVPQIIYVIFGFSIIHLTKNNIKYKQYKPSSSWGSSMAMDTVQMPGHHDFVPTQMLRILQLKPIENQNTADLDKEFFQWRWLWGLVKMG